MGRLRAVDVPFEAAESIEGTKDKIIELERGQMLHGLTSDGSFIGTYKSNAYAKKKNQMNPLPGLGFMDWKLTGELFRNFVVKVFRDGYVIKNTDQKFNDLVKRLGDPTGLDELSKKEYADKTLQPAFMGRMRKATGL